MVPQFFILLDTELGRSEQMAHAEVETVEFSRRDHQVPWEDGARVEMKDVRPRGQVRFLCSPENTQVLTAVFLGRIISKA